MAFENTPYACPDIPAPLSPAEAGALTRYIGDDWLVGPVTLAHGGTPLDLTGSTVSAEFYQAYALAPVATFTEASGVTMLADRTKGTITQIKVPRATTANVPPQPRWTTQFPTRLQVVVTDAAGNARTYTIVLFLPLDPRADVPPIATTTPATSG